MAHEPGAPLRVALLGCGVVGSAVATKLVENADDLAARVGAKLELVGIAVRRPQRPRPDVPVDPSLFTADAEELVTRADVVIEVIGGIEPARSLILRAMEHGASVVSANKALLAEDGPTLYAAADAARRRPLLRGGRGRARSRSCARSASRSPATTCAACSASSTAPPTSCSTRWTPPAPASPRPSSRRRPWATPRPTPPPTSRASTPPPRPPSSPASPSTPGSPSLDVHREGITEVTAGDIQAAKEMDCVVKLLAICEKVVRADGAPAVSVRVHPAMIPRSHPLASVREAFNAVFVEAAAAGELMFYGRGAGGDPTASAVLGDVVAVARHKVGRWPRAGGVGLRRPARRRHGPVPDEVPHQPRRGRPAGRARPGRGGVRGARRVDRDGAPAGRAGWGRAGQAHRRHPPGHGCRALGHRRRPRATSTPSRTSPPSCAWKEPEPWRTCGAE